MTNPPVTRDAIRYTPVPFSALPNWATDDHAAAFAAFLKSCRRLARSGRAKVDTSVPHASALVALCDSVVSSAPDIKSTAQARAFFEARFTPNRVQHAGTDGLLTGYYEPTLQGSRTPSTAFPTPIYRRPADLVNLVDEQQRGAVGAAFTHARQSASGPVPYATRSEIEQGALAGKNLELLYLASPVDVFFLQIQGSGVVKFPNGTQIRVSYDGKNGHPYTSIGRYLIDNGIIDAGRMSLAALGDWLRGAGTRGRDVMWKNKSYVFFRELVGAEAQSALGVLDIPLTPGRSMAVDAGYHALGLPIYVSSTALTHATSKVGFHRLMIAQDVGSAIRGPERGDLYFGSGAAAGALAGVTKHPGNFYVLLPTVATTVVKPAVPPAPDPRAIGTTPKQAPSLKPSVL